MAQRLVEVRRQTASPQAFTKRLYRWLNPLCVVKFANYLSAGPYPRIPVDEAAGRLLDGETPVPGDADACAQQVLRLLGRYRELDKD